MNETKTKYVYIKQSLFESIMADIFSWGSIIFSFWFNANFIGSKLLNDFLLFIILIMIYGITLKKSREFYSKESLIKFLKESKD